jgi:hypothetical protein
MQPNVGRLSSEDDHHHYIAVFWHSTKRRRGHSVVVVAMAASSASSDAATTTIAVTLTPLVSATWFDETLVSARKVNKLVVVRFGRSSDRLCQRCDAMLQQAVDVPEMASVLSLYTVDVDAVPEFSYMYELYDPFAIMLFHQSKPIVVDAGHGPVRKLTEINSTAWLRAMLLRAIRTTLDVRLEVSMAEAQSRGNSSGATDAPDAPASLKEEAARIAQGASEWLGAKSDVISHRVGAAMEQSGGWIQSVEERGWTVLQKASTSGLAALESARLSLVAMQRPMQRATGPAHFFAAPPAAAAAGGKPADARASDSTRASSPTAAAAAQQEDEPPESSAARIAVPVPAAEPEERNVHGERV